MRVPVTSRQIAASCRWLNRLGMTFECAETAWQRLWEKAMGDVVYLELLDGLIKEEKPKRLIRTVLELCWLCSVDLPNRIRRLETAWDPFLDWLEEYECQKGLGERSYYEPLVIETPSLNLELLRDRLLVIAANRSQAGWWIATLEGLEHHSQQVVKGVRMAAETRDVSVLYDCGWFLNRVCLYEQPEYLKDASRYLRRIESVIRLKASSDKEFQLRTSDIMALKRWSERFSGKSPKGSSWFRELRRHLRSELRKSAGDHDNWLTAAVERGFPEAECRQLLLASRRLGLLDA